MIRRRDLAWMLVASSAVEAQAPAAGDDLTAAARARVKANAEELRKFVIPMTTEPAFAFKA